MESVRITGRRVLFDDYLRVEAAEVEIPRRRGGSTGRHRLVRVERSDAVAVLPVDRAARELILVQQFRWPTFDKGPGWLTEIPAGVTEPGESAEETAHREVLEEAGLRLGALTPVADFYPTPGYSTERCRVFAGEVAEIEGEGGGSDPGEEIRLLRIGFDAVADWLAPGKIEDAKTLIALQWFLLAGQAEG